jgi:hypothetical protein
VGIDQIKYIGKESNSLEEVESGLVHLEQNFYTEYPDPRRDERGTKMQLGLKQVSFVSSAEEDSLVPQDVGRRQNGSHKAAAQEPEATRGDCRRDWCTLKHLLRIANMPTIKLVLRIPNKLLA